MRVLRIWHNHLKTLQDLALAWITHSLVLTFGSTKVFFYVYYPHASCTPRAKGIDKFLMVKKCMHAFFPKCLHYLASLETSPLATQNIAYLTDCLSTSHFREESVILWKLINCFPLQKGTNKYFRNCHAQSLAIRSSRSMHNQRVAYEYPTMDDHNLRDNK